MSSAFCSAGKQRRRRWTKLGRMLIYMLSALGIVAAGCDESSEAKRSSDSGAAQKIGDIDAALRLDASKSETGDMDTESGLDASKNGCVVLRSWVPIKEVRSPVAIRGADGFAGLTYDAAPDSGVGSVYVFDARGKAIRPIFLDVVPRPGPFTYGLGEAKAAGDLLAVMEVCQYKMNCGYTLLVNNNGSFYTAAYGSNSLFEAGSDVGSVAVFGDEDRSLLAIAPDDTIVVGTGGRIWRSSSNGLRALPGVGLARLDTLGRVIKSATVDLDVYLDRQYVVNHAHQLEVDEQNRTLVVLEPLAEIDSDSGYIYGTQSSSHIFLFNPEFVLAGTWTPPSGVSVQAIGPDGHGHVVIAGSSFSGGQTQVWLEELSLPTFGEIWPEPRIDGNGEALAINITQSGDFLVAGRDTVAGIVWLQRYDAKGAPLWSNRVIANDTDIAGIPGYMLQTNVSEQSDGSIFLSFSDQAFVCDK